MIIACGLFGAYVLNVVASAISGTTVLNEVQEMLVLLAASCAFAVVILNREAQAKQMRAEQSGAHHDGGDRPNPDKDTGRASGPMA